MIKRPVVDLVRKHVECLKHLGKMPCTISETVVESLVM
uniref:Uncharacterized protein n=1 Tax=Rhizophora mucronata TaxID=61149 RepID=A0A2P2J163_RHIMU